VFNEAAARDRLTGLTLRMVNLTDVDLSAVRSCFSRLRALQLNFVCFPVGVWAQLLGACFPGAVRKKRSLKNKPNSKYPPPLQRDFVYLC
jgi:hypothetical protein